MQEANKRASILEALWGRWLQDLAVAPGEITLTLRGHSPEAQAETSAVMGRVLAKEGLPATLRLVESKTVLTF
jgi:hypothetical protein